MEGLLGLGMGIGLSACCGFRVFLPLLALSIGAKWGHIPLAQSYEWIASWPALLALFTATVCEILAYYIPWIDHALDALMSPLSILAGTLITVSTFTADLPTTQKWILALMTGGGAAGVIQTGTVLARATSGATTLGLGNFLVSTLELLSAIFGVFLSLFIPLLIVGFVLFLFLFLIFRFFQKRKSTPSLS